MPSSMKSATGLMAQVSEELGVEERPAPLEGEAELDSREARQKLERKLLRKLDMRMSILVLIYILNYVRPVSSVDIGHRQRMLLYR
jgi:hypothetical protein